MAVKSRKKIIFIVFLIIALGIFLPPNINGARFRARLATALSNALGRPVRIGSVSFRVLPRPGFDLYDFEVADDPAFNQEPLLMCGKVTADLRLTSLWRGRLEIANLKLQNASDRVPPSLNLVYLNGHWNIESLLTRAEQVPTAPTSKKRAEQRARFPYIEADGGRINVKVGPEKKPFALINTDFAIWLAAEDLWHLRLQGHPVRADMNLADTGQIKIEGDLKRSSDLRQTPVKMQVWWENGQLGQLSKLSLGHDKGWRGSLNMKAELTGSLLDLHLTGEADLENFRRYDIDRQGMFDLNTRCQGAYNLGLLDFNCSVPVDTGGVRISGKFAPTEPQNYDLSLVANRVPLSAIARFGTFAKRTLPEDLTVTGQLDAAFGFHSHDNQPPDWHGAGSSSAFSVSSSVLPKPIQASSIRFHLGPMGKTREATTRNRKHRPAKEVAETETVALTVDPFSMQMGPGATMQVQGSFNSADYFITARGSAPIERILDLGNISGFRSRIGKASGEVNLDANIHGSWANFAPTQLGGSAHLDNVVAVIPGLRERLLLATADVHFGDTELVLIGTAQFEHSPVQVTGSISSPLNCTSDVACALQFDLRSDDLATEDVANLIGSRQTGWTLPFISGSDKLPDFRATGTFSVANLKLGELPLEKFIAQVEVGDRALSVRQINALIGDGSTQGEWRIDWSTSPARYSGSGALSGVSPERVALPDSVSSLLTSWISGKANINYSVDLSGGELLAGARAQAQFTIANGMSHVLMLEAARPVRFQGLQGKCVINHGVLELLPSKFKAENRIYELSGTISLADKQAKLKVSNSASQWEITGALEKPSITVQRLTAQQLAPQTQ